MSQQDDDFKFALYCDSLESQYREAKKGGLFEVLKVFELDKEHSDKDLFQAVEYFRQKNGIVEADAPTAFLTGVEKKNVYKDGRFRHGLYCMLLSAKFAEGIENRTLFLEHSFSFAFDNM